jgi:hypothetical protein
MALGLAGDQFRREALLAVRADDLLRACFSGDFGHKAKVPWSLPLGEVEAVGVERRALWRRRLTAW